MFPCRGKSALSHGSLSVIEKSALEMLEPVYAELKDLLAKTLVFR